MEDNNLGVAGGLPEDFVTRFEHPAQWEHTLRAIDTLYLRESSIRNAENKITQQVLRDTIAPVLNANQVDIAVDTGAATWLGRRASLLGKTRNELLDDHVMFIQQLLDAGLRVKTVSLQSVLSKPIENENWADYPVADRIVDVVEYIKRLHQTFPSIDVGIIDALPTHNRDWEGIYSQLIDSLSSEGYRLDHLHLDMPVDYLEPTVGGEKAIFRWEDVIQIQNYAKLKLGIEFGWLATSLTGGDESSREWRRDVIFSGINKYAQALAPVDGVFPSQPDRIIITSWSKHPEMTIPEEAVKDLADGTTIRVETMTNTIKQASNVLRGLGDNRGSRLIDEIQQVPPVRVFAGSDPKGAEDAGFARGVVDATTTLDAYRWNPSPTDIDNGWIVLQLPVSANLNRIRVWPTVSPAISGTIDISVYASSVGGGSPSNADTWQLIGERSVSSACENSYCDVEIDVHQKRFIGLRLSTSTPTGIIVRGLNAVRVYSPNNEWNKSLIDANEPSNPDGEIEHVPPSFFWQKVDVFSGDPGATIGKLLAGCCDAAGEFELTVNDTRFGFFLSFLHLKAGEMLDRTIEPTVTVRVTLKDRKDPTRVFETPYTFSVLPMLDSEGRRRDIFDYGDSSGYDREFPTDTAARHLVGSLYLGKRVDAEIAAQNDFFSRGDDMDADGDDDDGIIFIGDIRSSDQGGIATIRVESSGRGMLDGWIDFNKNRIFDSSTEHLWNGVSVPLLPGIQFLTFRIPPNVPIGRTFARFRISEEGRLRAYDSTPRTPSVVGEVEDYYFETIGSSTPTGLEPIISWELFPVTTNVPGATIAKVLADGFDANVKYDLAVADDRMEFDGTFLRLKPTVALSDQANKTVRTQVFLVNKTDPSQSIARDLSFFVQPVQVQAFDFGDAPFRYDTTLEEDGPRHRLTHLSLGRRVDSDANGQNHYLALGDDLDDNGDDDDGVVLAVDMISSGRNEIATLGVDASADAFLDAWIDFNGNGRFDHPIEHLGQNLSDTSMRVTQGLNVIDFVVPAWAKPGSTFARFRISTEGGLSPNGESADGEVEDYNWIIHQPTQNSSKNFAIPRFKLADQPIVPLHIGRIADQLLVSSEQRLLATFLREHTPELRLIGTPGDDVVELQTPQLLVEGELKLSLDDGINLLQFSSESAFETSQLPRSSLRGVTRIDFRQGEADSIIVEPESLIAAIDTSLKVAFFTDGIDAIHWESNWSIASPVLSEQGWSHVVEANGLQILLQNGKDWTNPINQFDVNGNGETSAVDALEIINWLNRQNEEGDLPTRREDNAHEGYFDVSGDNRATALDALNVINQLNRQSIAPINIDGASSNLAQPSPIQTGIQTNAYQALPAVDAVRHVKSERIVVRNYPRLEIGSPVATLLYALDEEKGLENRGDEISPKSSLTEGVLRGNL